MANHYVIENAAWNATIAAGGTATFGFTVAASGTAAPANYLLNGVPLGPTGLTLAAGSSNWTNAGLTLTVAADTELHLYQTGTTTDSVSPLPPAYVGSVQVQGPAATTNTLTVNFSSGNPIPSGGATYNGGQAGKANALLLTGTPSGETVTISGPQITVGTSAAITASNVSFLGINAGGTGTAGLSGTSGLVKTGPGTLILTGTNSVSGPIVVLAGTVQATSSTAIPSGANLTVGGNAGQFSSAASVAAAAIAVPALPTGQQRRQSPFAPRRKRTCATRMET